MLFSIFFPILLPLMGGPVQETTKDERAELSKLEGTWEVIECEMDGKRLGLAERKGETIFSTMFVVKALVVKGDTAEIHWQEAKKTSKVSFVLDLTAKPICASFGPEGNRGRCEYLLDQDNLKILIHNDTKMKEKLPKELETHPNDGNYIFILRRANKDK